MLIGRWCLILLLCGLALPSHARGYTVQMVSPALPEVEVPAVRLNQATALEALRVALHATRLPYRLMQPLAQHKTLTLNLGGRLPAVLQQLGNSYGFFYRLQDGLLQINGDAEFLVQTPAVPIAALAKELQGRGYTLIGSSSDGLRLSTNQAGYAALLTYLDGLPQSVSTPVQPVATQPATPPPNSTEWVINEQDASVEKLFARWAASAGWRLSWEVFGMEYGQRVVIDYPLSHGGKLGGDLQKAIRTVLRSLHLQDAVTAVFYQGNRVLRISNQAYETGPMTASKEK